MARDLLILFARIPRPRNELEATAFPVAPATKSVRNRPKSGVPGVMSVPGFNRRSCLCGGRAAQGTQEP